MKSLLSTLEFTFGTFFKRARAGILISLLAGIFVLLSNDIALTQCNCTTGDVNNDQYVTALADVIYFVRYLRGGPTPPYESCPECPIMYPACDINGNGAVNGIDVSYFVGYWKGFQSQIMPGCCEFLALARKQHQEAILIEPGLPDEVVIGNVDGSAIDVILGETVYIPVWVKNDENVPALAISVVTDDQFLTPSGGTLMWPLNDWDDCSIGPPVLNTPPGHTTQTILGWNDISLPQGDPFLNTYPDYVQIATLAINVNLDPANIGQNTSMTFGAGWRVGETAFCNEAGTEEWMPVLQPATLHILPPSLSFIGGNIFRANNDDCVQDPGEAGLLNWQVTADDGQGGVYNASTNQFGGFLFSDLPAATYTISEELQANWALLCPVTGSYSIVLAEGQQIGEVNFANRPSTITGSVFYANNTDCIQDPGEPGLPTWQVVADNGSNTYNATVDWQGSYSFASLSPGSYTISEVLLPNWAYACPIPGTYSIVLGLGQEVTGIDFANTPTGPIVDMSCNVGGGPARPGFLKTYGIMCGYNYYIYNPHADVVLTLSEVVEYVSSYPPGAVYDPGNHTLTWAFEDFPPGGRRWLQATVLVPAEIAIGTLLMTTAEIMPVGGDLDPSNNIDVEWQWVRGSFDPNEKLVTPEGVIERTDQLIYQINFQNVGNDTAFTVVVRDTLDPNLDLSTFASGASIHPYTYAINGREIVWTFDDILLPDSFVNEAASHGLVRFTAHPISSVPAGTFIENWASIFFDFNPPVITNTVSNQIAMAPPCAYFPGDINSNATANGIDVVYGVNYLKGGSAPPDSCDCPPLAFPFYAAMDVNGNCSANGIDITFFVSYLKGVQPALLHCPNCPPADLMAPPAPQIEAIQKSVLQPHNIHGK